MFATRIGAAAAAFALAASFAPVERAGAAADPYFLGVVVSESGSAATLGRPAADSIQLAVDEINAAGGVNGHPLQVQILDDESNATTAVSDARQLLDKHPIAIIGASLTQTTLAMAPLIQAKEIPLISLASNAQVIEPIADHKWQFKMPITDTRVAEVIQTFLRKRNATHVAFIYRDDDYGKSGLDHFKSTPDFKGFDILSADAIAATATDATTQITRAKSSNPNAIVAWTSMPSANVVLKAYREAGLTTPLIYADGSATGVFPLVAGPAINGAYIASTKITVVDELASSDPQKRVLSHYTAEFAKAYPKDGISIFGGFGYDSVYVLKNALEHAKSADGNRLRDAIEHVTYSGVTGTFRFSPTDHKGLSGDSIVVTQLENQKFHIAK